MDHSFIKFDIVQVKSGVIDRETGTNLGGWQGRIFDFLEDEDGDTVAYVRWDGPTIRQIPKDYINFCMHNGLSWVDILIGVESLSPGLERDTPDSSEWQRLEVVSQYSWPQFGKAGQKALDVIKTFSGNDGSVLQAWEKYLKDHLQFPFTARIRKAKKSPNQKVVALELNGAEDVYGVTVIVEIDGRKAVIPAIDLVLPHNSKNYAFLEAYSFWLKNR